jgi:hypothetical protein
MKIQYPILATALMALLLPGLPAKAGEKGPDFGFNASAGYQYDSNVNVAELDTNTGEADGALLLSAGVNAALPLTKNLSFNVGYDYSQTSYREFPAFDVAMHHGLAEFAYDVAGFNTALTFDRFDVRLDGDRFLEIDQVSPSVARLFGESFYLRGAFTRAGKRYASANNRDADNDSVRADAYLLFDGMNRYLSFGYRVDSEDALDAELDFDGNRAMLAYGHRIELGSLSVETKTRVQYENRDYVNVTASIGERRHDQRLRAGFSAEIPVTEYFSIESDVEYADNRSNLVSAAFDEMVYGVKLALDF